ncbi:hypothetical protein [Algoriphagus aquimarinus]|uniref:hypothetical protein n=1 Tax=Algoriphagus aquimarinus TaxID=237018 RepID=UPI0030D709F9|tara:strand:- start:195798 stop:196511 length:714 start_codon:yes stop_codon:yes gene_type:complete
MIRQLSFLFFLLLAQNAFGQKVSAELLKNVLYQLEIDEDKCFMTLVSSLEIPNDETIVVIPEIEESGEETAVLNSHILIVNTSTGNIKSSFYKQNAWYTDAIRINRIEISYQPFKLNSTSQSIAITIGYEGISRINLIGIEELSLYERNGAEINLLLENFPSYRFIGENDGIGNGEYEEHQKKIEPSSGLTNGYYNLVVKDSVRIFQTKDGDEKIIEKRLETEILKFQNGEYRSEKN